MSHGASRIYNIRQTEQRSRAQSHAKKVLGLAQTVHQDAVQKRCQRHCKKR